MSEVNPAVLLVPPRLLEIGLTGNAVSGRWWEGRNTGWWAILTIPGTTAAPATAPT